MELERIRPMNYERIYENCRYIRNVYHLCGVNIIAGSWLWNMLSMLEKVGQGKWIESPSEIRNKVKWDLTSQIVMVQVFAADLKTCADSNVPIREKLKKAYETYSMADSVLQEIHNLACIIRSGQKAKFIDPIPNVQTPDIEIEWKGVLECKVMKSPSVLRRRLKESAKQMSSYPGEKVVNFLIHFLKPDNIERYLDDLMGEAYVETKKIYEENGSLNGVTFSFLVPEELGNAHRIQFQTIGFAVKRSDSVIQIIESLKKNCLGQ